MSRPTRLRSRTYVLLTAMAAVIPFLTAPTAAATSQAEAAYITRYFNAEYGNTYSRGQVTFYNRSVLVDGQHKSVSSSSCRYTVATSFTASGTILGRDSAHRVCNRSEAYSFTLPADVAGGADRVDVSLVHYETGEVLDTDTIWRI